MQQRELIEKLLKNMKHDRALAFVALHIMEEANLGELPTLFQTFCERFPKKGKDSKPSFGYSPLTKSQLSAFLDKNQKSIDASIAWIRSLSSGQSSFYASVWQILVHRAHSEQEMISTLIACANSHEIKKTEYGTRQPAYSSENNIIDKRFDLFRKTDLSKCDQAIETFNQRYREKISNVHLLAYEIYLMLSKLDSNADKQCFIEHCLETVAHYSQKDTGNNADILTSTHDHLQHLPMPYLTSKYTQYNPNKTDDGSTLTDLTNTANENETVHTDEKGDD